MRPTAAYQSVKETWLPILNVALIIGHTTSKKFEAIVDSGSPVCLFHADIAKAHSLNFKSGQRDDLIGGSKGEAYYHKIKLKVMGEIISITGGFSEHLSVAAIIGRHGFFDNFMVTFDPCNNPPGLIIERIYRA